MIHIQLPAAEADRLEQAFRRETDPKYKDRLQIIRLASRDRPHQDLARDLATTPRSVQRWLNTYLEKGLDGLRPRKAKGRTPKIPPAMDEDIKRWVIQGPAQQGLDRANWTHEELADHLFKTKRIKASRSAMQRFCRKVGIRVYGPTFRVLRGYAEKLAQAKEDIKEAEGESPGRRDRAAEPGRGAFPDGANSHGDVGVKGHRPVVGTWDCKDLLYVFAVVNLLSCGTSTAIRWRSPKDAKKKTGKSKTRRLQEAFAQHLRHVGRLLIRRTSTRRWCC